MANNREGWISIHRAIQDNWIWKDGNKLKWWLDILLTVNNATAKVNIGNLVFECKRGESLLSLQSWASRWGVSKDTARNFLKLLEKDEMIVLSTLHGVGGVTSHKSTRITVCKYDTYQQGLHVKQTLSVRTLYTNNNEDNENNNITASDESAQLENSIPVKPLKPKKEKPVNQNFNSCKKSFMDFYEEKYNDEYYFEAKDGDKLTRLIAKIKNKVKVKKSTANNEQLIKFVDDGFIYFLKASHKNADRFLIDNFTLTRLDSDFNSIYAKIKNGGSVSQISSTTLLYTEKPKPIDHADRK